MPHQTSLLTHAHAAMLVPPCQAQIGTPSCNAVSDADCSGLVPPQLTGVQGMQAAGTLAARIAPSCPTSPPPLQFPIIAGLALIGGGLYYADSQGMISLQGLQGVANSVGAKVGVAVALWDVHAWTAGRGQGSLPLEGAAADCSAAPGGEVDAGQVATTINSAL